MTVRQVFISLSIGISILVLFLSYFWQPVLWLFVIILPIVLLGIADIVKSFSELYESIESDCLLKDDIAPKSWQTDWINANAERW